MNNGDLTHLIIAIEDGKGQIIDRQLYSDFLSGNRSIPILNYYTGRKLFDILFDQLGIIKLEDNVLALNTIFNINPHKTVMSLLGKVAEAVIVRRCSEDEDINRKWLSKARRVNTKKETAAKFSAVGTGLKPTATKYPTIYNPTNPQRDIIWVDEDRRRALIGSSSSCAGMEAGLQIKVSHDGMKYIFKDLCRGRYEIPLVYFDIGGDFYRVESELVSYFQRINSTTRIINGENFVDPRAVDRESFEEICYYEDLLTALVNGRLRIDDLLKNPAYAPTDSLKNAMVSEMVSSVPLDNRIIH